MSVTIDLEPELEAVLSKEADLLKMTLPEYVNRALMVGRVPNPVPRTGAEMLAYWERRGVLGNRPDITDPIAYARELRKQSETRKRD